MSTPDQDVNASIIEISSPECMELLRGEEVGRIGVVVRGQPEIFPVNYTLDSSDSIVLRTANGMKLGAAVNNAVVFEVDRIDAGLKTGWSVIVHGVAHQTERIDEGAGPLSPWPEGTTHLLRISHTSVTGRRVAPSG